MVAVNALRCGDPRQTPDQGRGLLTDRGLRPSRRGGECLRYRHYRVDRGADRRFHDMSPPKFTQAIALGQSRYPGALIHPSIAM